MGRNPESNRQARDDRREQILSAALRLFAARGLSATKTSCIAAAANASQGLVYHYFASKEAIFTALIREAFAKMTAACLMLESLPLPPEEKARMAARELLSGLVRHEDTARYHLLIMQASASEAIPEEAKAIIQEQGRVPYEVMTRIFAAGQSTGVFQPDPPEMLAMLFWTTIKGICIHKATHGDDCVIPDPEIIMRMFMVSQAPVGG